MSDENDTRQVNRDAESGQFVDNETATDNPKTTVTETVPVSRTKANTIEAQRDRAEKAAKVAEDERVELERMIDADIAQRTATYDQSIKERAAAVGVNPDNFDTEAALETAVIPLEPTKEDDTDAES